MVRCTGESEGGVWGMVRRCTGESEGKGWWMVRRCTGESEGGVWGMVRRCTVEVCCDDYLQMYVCWLLYPEGVWGHLV